MCAETQKAKEVEAKKEQMLKDGFGSNEVLCTLLTENALHTHVFFCTVTYFCTVFKCIMQIFYSFWFCMLLGSSCLFTRLKLHVAQTCTKFKDCVDEVLIYLLVFLRDRVHSWGGTHLHVRLKVCHVILALIAYFKSKITLLKCLDSWMLVGLC